MVLSKLKEFAANISLVFAINFINFFKQRYCERNACNSKCFYLCHSLHQGDYVVISSTKICRRHHFRVKECIEGWSVENTIRSTTDDFNQNMFFSNRTLNAESCCDVHLLYVCGMSRNLVSVKLITLLKYVSK